MGDASVIGEAGKQSSADQIFERLHGDIVNMRLLPGSKLSEGEVARQHEVSRQPVREAFIRLSNMNLLLVRPQKATVVRPISLQDIQKARFLRIAVETEVVRRACSYADDAVLAEIEANLSLQKVASARHDLQRFHRLDYDFHRLLCCAAGLEFAFDSIVENKAQVDRICMLSLLDDAEITELYRDHRGIFQALLDGDEDDIVWLTRQHLSRLDRHLVEAEEAHPEYFCA